jgi:hypothetical protein
MSFLQILLHIVLKHKDNFTYCYTQVSCQNKQTKHTLSAVSPVCLFMLPLFNQMCK